MKPAAEIPHDGLFTDPTAARVAIRELEGKLVGMMATFLEFMEALEMIALGEHEGGKPLEANEMRAIARSVGGGAMELPKMDALMIDGVLYVRETDCRQIVNVALAQKKPLLAENAALIAALETIADGAVMDQSKIYSCNETIHAYQRLARAALAKARQ